MSTGDGVPYKSQNPIQVHSSRNFELKLHENERNLVVYWNEEDFMENSSQKKSKVIICHVEGYSLDDLVFTGSEFDNVVLVAGRNIDTTSQEFLIVLYKIISRARKTVTVFSHPSNLTEFESLLKFSDTDVYFDKQRCDDNLSSVTFSNLSSSKEEDIRQPNALKFSEIEKYIDAMMNHAEDPLSTYNKAFAQFFNADLRTAYQLIGFLISFAFSSGFQFNPETLAYFGELMFGGMIQNGFQFMPCNRFEFVDSSCKFMDEVFMKLFELSAPFFPELFIREHKQILEFCGKFETIRKNPFFMKFNMACYVLNAEEFRQFLDQLAISSDTLFAKIDGSFLIFKAALFKLNPDEFSEFLKSVGVDSLKLSHEQFLDDDRNNILMYCVSKTRRFYMVADWAHKQGYLDELLSQRNCDGETCFVLACKHDNFGLVKMLLQNYQYDWLRDGFNAILALCKNGNILIFKHLLCTLKGENVKMMLDSMRGSEGESILMITTFNAKMMETFLNFSMEENFFDRMLYEKDALGHSCFFWAVILENIESIQSLIDRHKFDWRTDCDLNGYTIAHLLCALKRPDVLHFFVENYGHEFIEVAHELNYEGYSCLEIACFAACSVEVVQMVLDTLNDSLPLPQNLTQLLRCLIAANEENGENKNKILDCLVSHMLQKLSFGYHEDKIKQHYLVYALDPEDMLEIGARILTGPKELGEADSGEPDTFSLGSWQCIFWAVTEHKELRILTNQPVCKMSAILARSEGSCINIFASWEYLDFFIDNLADHRLPEFRTPTCFKSWEEFYEKEFTGFDKLITRKCCNKNSHCELVSLLEDIDLD